MRSQAIKKAILVIAGIVGGSWSLLSATPAFATDRVALLIGNSAYSATSGAGSGWNRLPNPTNDVNLVADALRSIDFKVAVVTDGNWETLQRELDAFSDRSANADIALFYFAGHGFEYSRRNYLVPVDAPSSTTSSDLPRRFVDFEQVASGMARARTAIFLLDACRTGAPFVTIAQDDAPAGAVMRGVNDYDFPSGAQIAILYSTGRGIPAQDSAPPPENYSPFAWEVARSITVPHVEISTVFNVIRQGVYDRTRDFSPAQSPYTYNSLAPNIYINESPSTGEPSTYVPKALEIDAEELGRTDETVLVVRALREHSVDDIRQLAERGDPIATYVLGYMQEFGLGVPRDLVQARATLERAAAFGTPSGQLELAYFLHNNPTQPDDLKRAVDLYRAAATQGFAKARGHLARVLMAGELVPHTQENYERGLAQLRLAAQDDYPYAMYSLAKAGEAQERERWKAELLTLTYAGNDDAHHWLCSLEAEGQNFAAAAPHCGIAAAAGYPDAQGYMALIADRGEASEQSRRTALHWMRQALSRPELDADMRAQLASLSLKLGEQNN